MNFRKSIVLLIALGMIAALVACSSSSKSTPPAITVSLSSAPSSVLVNGTISITATVANDSANAGVTWSVTCGSSGSGACGAFSSANTASGTAVTYTAPAAVPTGNTVTITATSVTDTSASASTAAITINAIPTVSLSTPPTAVYVSDYFSITATTTDPAGVTWSAACVDEASPCGSFSSTSSLTGVAVTYTAPANPDTVTITATSVTDTAITASTAAITVNATSGYTVSISTPPPSTMTAGATATIAATTTDPAGVNWSCSTTGSAACSSSNFSPASTASGATTTFTAPAGAETVTITATSVADDAISNSATVTVTSGTSGGLSNGNYTFYLSGLDTDDYSLFFVAGTFNVSGGAITGGEQDYVDYNNLSNGGVGGADSINATGSSIVTTGDGNVQIVLNVCSGTDCTSNDTAVGVGGVETINAALRPTNPNRAVLTEFDSSGSASGEMRQQDTTAAGTTPAMGYAFTVSGFDTNEIVLNMGGIINVDGSGTISGAGSIFDVNDDSSGTTFQGETLEASSSTVSAPDAFGRVVFTITPSDSVDFPQIVWVGYIADSGRIYLVETADNYVGTTGGIAYSQGANTGTFGTSSVSGGTYGSVLTGFDANGPLQSVAQLTFNSNGTISGNIDFNDLSGSEPVSPDPVTAPSYTVDSTGRVTITGLTDTSNSISLTVQFYLDGNGEAVGITMDTTETLGSTLGGQITTADTDANFTGTYALVTEGWDGGESGEFSAVGSITATGVGDTFSGFTDVNFYGTTTTNATLSGSYTFDETGILSPSYFTGLDIDSTFANTDQFNIYMIGNNGSSSGPGDGVFIETDSNQLTIGFFQQ
ncbi:MAG: beta strand repeat-containing protein [Candidatus Sulfotelmatobacter sp.]